MVEGTNCFSKFSYKVANLLFLRADPLIARDPNPLGIKFQQVNFGRTQPFRSLLSHIHGSCLYEGFTPFLIFSGFIRLFPSIAASAY
jgi:hypothetical protein